MLKEPKVAWQYGIRLLRRKGGKLKAYFTALAACILQSPHTIW